MSSLDVMKEEIRNMSEIKVSIIERLIQVDGDLYEYSPFLGDNIQRVKGCFLCIDKTDQF